MVCSLLSEAQPQPKCRASFGCLGYVSGALGGEVGSLSSSFFFSPQQSLMLYMGGKALLMLRAACLWCGWNLWMQFDQPFQCFSGGFEFAGQRIVAAVGPEICLTSAGGAQGQVWALLPFNPLSLFWPPGPANVAWSPPSLLL